MNTPAFREHASGLIVPNEISRLREVMRVQDYRLLDRAAKAIAARGLSMYLGCQEPGCQGQPLERIRNSDGGITLRCAHRDLVVVKGL